MTTFAARPVGRHAVLLEVEDALTARNLAAWARSGGVSCVDAVPGARTVLLDGIADLDRTLRAVAAHLEQTPATTDGGPGAPVPSEQVVTLPVHYDGPDLARVAAHWGVPVDEVVRRHTGTEFVSAFCGFAPGFAYLEGLPQHWSVPRLETPRPRVPAGAVALADTWCGVYPTASPGGWLLLGTTDVVVWDLTAESGPALLAPGVRVRFEAR